MSDQFAFLAPLSTSITFSTQPTFTRVTRTQQQEERRRSSSTSTSTRKSIKMPKMVKTPIATPVPSGRESNVTAAKAERWLITICGAPENDAGLLRAMIEHECRQHEGEVETWRKLGVDAHELTARIPAIVEESLRLALNTIGSNSGSDVILQSFGAVRGGKRLAVFDLDSTLIAEETIDELAAEAGASERVRALTKRAMAGDLGFRDALAERVAILEGLDIDALERVKQRATLTLGAKQCVEALKKTGCITAVVSGGFNFLADHVRDVLGLDYSFANTLDVKDGKLTGETKGEIVDAQFKADVLTKLAKKFNIQPERVMAVGDGSNDVIMLQRAGLGVAFNAKPKVQSVSKARVNQPSLNNVLYLLGLDDNQILELLEKNNLVE